MDLGRAVGDAIFGMMVFGIAIGVLLCGLVWGAWWLFSHLSISWVP